MACARAIAEFALPWANTALRGEVKGHVQFMATLLTDTFSMQQQNNGSNTMHTSNTYKLVVVISVAKYTC